MADEITKPQKIVWMLSHRLSCSQVSPRNIHFPLDAAQLPQELQPIASSEDEGWYRTGDLGALDAEGNLFFKGRKKEVIVTPAAMNIYPDDLEAALRVQREVRDCVVVGLERGGNAEPCAVLILRDYGPESSAEVPGIVQRANETLGEYQRMRSWFVWPEEDFPRSATQKPKRNLIREAAEAGLRGQALANSASPLAELLMRITGRTLPNLQNLTPEANLENGLGLSSLERVELLGALEDRYQVDVSETKFASVTTIGDLEKLLQSGAATVSLPGIPLSAVGLALAGYVAARSFAVSAGSPSAFSSGVAARDWAGESAGRARAATGGLQSHRRCGYCLHSDGASGADSSQAGDSRRW